MHKTTLILGIPKDLSKEEVSRRKSDLKQIRKFLIRQSYSECNEESEHFKNLKTLSFIEFLFEVGMFGNTSRIEKISEKDKKLGYERYINALSVAVRGTGKVFLKRNLKDIFTNNYNRRLLEIHKANHDIQIVIDQVIEYFFLYISSNSSFLSMHVLNMWLDISLKMKAG